MNCNDEYGEPYDYVDTPQYWAERDMERQIIENEREERSRYGD